MGQWGGRRAQAIRARIAATLPRPCSRCGQPVYAEQRWHVDHVVPRRLGGGTFEEALLEPAHAACNMAAGASIVGSSSSRRRVSRATQRRTRRSEAVSLGASDTPRPPFRGPAPDVAPPTIFTRSAPIFAEEAG